MKVKLADLETREGTERAMDNFNKYAAAEKFEHLAMLYRTVQKSRAKGRQRSCKAAEELVELINNGITFSELENWLL